MFLANLDVSAAELAGFQPLLQALDQAGVEVRFDQPPRAGVYGLYEPQKKRLWVSPLTKPLGIFQRTLLHEAVHAAQACPTGVPG